MELVCNILSNLFDFSCDIFDFCREMTQNDGCKKAGWRAKMLAREERALQKLYMQLTSELFISLHIQMNFNGNGPTIMYAHHGKRFDMKKSRVL